MQVVQHKNGNNKITRDWRNTRVFLEAANHWAVEETVLQRSWSCAAKFIEVRLFAYRLSTCRTLFGDEELDFARSTGLKIATSAALHTERRCCAWASKRDKCKCIEISNFDLRSSTTDSWRIVDNLLTC